MSVSRSFGCRLDNLDKLRPFKGLIPFGGSSSGDPEPMDHDGAEQDGRLGEDQAGAEQDGRLIEDQAQEEQQK